MDAQQDEKPASLGDWHLLENTFYPENDTLRTYHARMSDRTLPRGAIAAVGIVGFLLLVLAARTEGYWQGLLINLGTGALLFAALEHMLYGTVQRVTKLVTGALAAFSSQRGIEWESWATQLSNKGLPAVRNELQGIEPLPTAKLEQLQQELTAVDQMNVADRMKRMSYIWVLADKYGVEPVRQVMESGPVTNAS